MILNWKRCQFFSLLLALLFLVAIPTTSTVTADDHASLQQQVSRVRGEMQVIQQRLYGAINTLNVINCMAELGGQQLGNSQ